jgi:hypothetical protein
VQLLEMYMWFAAWNMAGDGFGLEYILDHNLAIDELD